MFRKHPHPHPHLFKTCIQIKEEVIIGMVTNVRAGVSLIIPVKSKLCLSAKIDVWIRVLGMSRTA
jgi:hypothetical protein